MPDITMCSGDACNRKDSCYRHTATPSEFRQSYFCTSPVLDSKDGDCVYYWNDSEFKSLNTKPLPKS